MTEDRLRAAVETWATFYGPVEDHGYTKVAVQYDPGQAEYEARLNVLAALAAPRPEPLDVARLARAFHAKNEKTAATFEDVPGCDHDDDRPECVGEAESIALEYAALAPSEPTDG